MLTKLCFFIFEYYIDDQASPNDDYASKLRAGLRSALLLINSLFLMSLHLFV